MQPAGLRTFGLGQWYTNFSGFRINWRAPYNPEGRVSLQRFRVMQVIQGPRFDDTALAACGQKPVVCKHEVLGRFERKSLKPGSLSTGPILPYCCI
jgi:hypothetical protein